MTSTSSLPTLSNVRPIAAGRRHLVDLLTEWSQRYPNVNTRKQYYDYVDKLFIFVGTTNPEAITEAHVAQWSTAGNPANNSVRARLMAARAFLTWCPRNGYQVRDLDLAHVRSAHPRTYGKAQAPFPARFLSKEELRSLIAACQDGTWQGSKDQLIVRLGTHSLRLSEIANLRWRDVNGNQLKWIGKGNKPRTVTASPTLTDQLAKWKRYLATLGPVLDDHPVLPATRPSGHGFYPGKPTPTRTIRDRIAIRADLAGLGHVAVHDLRRTCASILHSARTPDGGHLFDLRDVQHVMGHASPETTDRSYLSQLDRDNLDRAAEQLD
jgi:integrase